MSDEQLIIKGLSPEVIETEFPDDAEVWLIFGDENELLTMAHKAGEERDVVQFFMKREDAAIYAERMQQTSGRLEGAKLSIRSVKLKETMRMVLESGVDVILHSPNEMYRYFLET